MTSARPRVKASLPRTGRRGRRIKRCRNELRLLSKGLASSSKKQEKIERRQVCLCSAVGQHNSLYNSCSNCTFTAQFESALKMHRQLHHDSKDTGSLFSKPIRLIPKRPNTVPLSPSLSSTYSVQSNIKETKSRYLSTALGRTSSATRLLGKLRSRLSKSRLLFSHPEEDLNISTTTVNDPGGVETIGTDYPKPVKAEPSTSGMTDINVNQLLNDSKLVDDKETFGCHLCSFDADRITALDRHLLNDHKIGLENLLKLVMAKTKDGLSEDAPTHHTRQAYYKLQDEIIEDEEFLIETVTPKIKILKHASTNTDIQWSGIPDFKNNCQMITAELEKIIKYPIEKCDKNDFMVKMQTLNECMCKFVDSSNTLKKVLVKEFDSKRSVREHLVSEQPFFDLCLGEGNKKLSSESFYF